MMGSFYLIAFTIDQSLNTKWFCVFSIYNKTFVHLSFPTKCLPVGLFGVEFPCCKSFWHDISYALHPMWWDDFQNALDYHLKLNIFISVCIIIIFTSTFYYYLVFMLLLLFNANKIIFVYKILMNPSHRRAKMLLLHVFFLFKRCYLEICILFFMGYLHISKWLTAHQSTPTS